MTVQVADIASERVTPGLVLFQGDVTIFAEHISEVTECNALANLVTFVGRIGDALYLPEVTELVENLCFCVAHGANPFDFYRIHQQRCETTDRVEVCRVSQHQQNAMGGRPSIKIALTTFCRR